MLAEDKLPAKPWWPYLAVIAGTLTGEKVVILKQALKESSFFVQHENCLNDLVHPCLFCFIQKMVHPEQHIFSLLLR